MICPRCGNGEDFEVIQETTTYCNSCNFSWNKGQDPERLWLIRARRYKKMSPPLWESKWMDPDEIDHGSSMKFYQKCPACSTLHLIVFEDGFEKCHYCRYQSSGETAK